MYNGKKGTKKDGCNGNRRKALIGNRKKGTNEKDGSDPHRH